jgi:hypothetical protein
MIGSTILFFPLNFFFFFSIKFHLANFVLGCVCTPPYTQRLFLEIQKRVGQKTKVFGPV